MRGYSIWKELSLIFLHINMVNGVELVRVQKTKTHRKSNVFKDTHLSVHRACPLGVGQWTITSLIAIKTVKIDCGNFFIIGIIVY